MAQNEDNSKIEGKFNLWETFKDDDGQWRWRCRAGENNQIIATSGEGYTEEAHADHMVRRLTGGHTMNRFKHLN